MRLLLFLLFLASATVLAARTLAGPFTFLLPVRSPLNLESLCGLAVIVLLALRTLPAHDAAGRSPVRADVLVWFGLAALILVAFARTAPWYFLSDDFILLKFAAAATHNLRVTFTTAGGDGFYRPLIYASFAVSRIPLYPAAWHAVNLAGHFLNSLLVFWLASQLRFSRFAASLAAALFAIHATRPEVAIWVTGRFDLFATFFVLLTLVLFLHSRDATHGAWWKFAALLAMVLGLICKESAYAAPVALLVWMLAAGDWRSRRALAYAPFFAAAAAIFAYRWSLFHGIGGYLTPEGTPQVASLHAASVAKALFFRVWAILFFPINWSIPPEVWLGIAMLLYLGALAVISSARVPRRSLAIAFALLAAFLLPVIPVMLIGADLEKARYLYLPSAAFCMALALAIEASRWRWGAAAAVLIFQFAALSHNLTPWKSAAKVSQFACEMLARGAPSERSVVAGLPGYLDGVQVFANGFKECVDLENPQHGPLIVVPDRAALPPRASFDRAFVWDENSRSLKRID